MKLSKYFALAAVMVLALQGLLIAPVFAETHPTDNGVTDTHGSSDDNGDGTSDGDSSGDGDETGVVGADGSGEDDGSGDGNEDETGEASGPTIEAIEPILDPDDPEAEIAEYVVVIDGQAYTMDAALVGDFALGDTVAFTSEEDADGNLIITEIAEPAPGDDDGDDDDGDDDGHVHGDGDDASVEGDDGTDASDDGEETRNPNARGANALQVLLDVLASLLDAARSGLINAINRLADHLDVEVDFTAFTDADADDSHDGDGDNSDDGDDSDGGDSDDADDDSDDDDGDDSGNANGNSGHGNGRDGNNSGHGGGNGGGRGRH